MSWGDFLPTEETSPTSWGHILLLQEKALRRSREGFGNDFYRSKMYIYRERFQTFNEEQQQTPGFNTLYFLHS